MKKGMLVRTTDKTTGRIAHINGNIAKVEFSFPQNPLPSSWPETSEKRMSEKNVLLTREYFLSDLTPVFDPFQGETVKVGGQNVVAPGSAG
jgi:hypothetical protein